MPETEKTIEPKTIEPETVESVVAPQSPEIDRQQLLAAIRLHGLNVTTEQLGKLAQYCRVMWDWNSKLNLTRHTDWDLFVTRDLIDTIELAKHIPQQAKVMDVGSGGGVPGIPLAIIRPDLSVALCESIGKKAAALKDIVVTLKLTIPVHADRAEVILKKHRFQFVTARAVASIGKMVGWFAPVWAGVGQLLLIKGPRWTDEFEQAKDEGLLKKHSVDNIAAWSTPGRDSQSVLLRISRSR